MSQILDLDNLEQRLLDLDDGTVCLALADLLAERGDPAAVAARQLADATPAIPEANPLLAPGQRLAVYPLACSDWWVIEQRVAMFPRRKVPVWAVTIRFYDGAEILLRLERSARNHAVALLAKAGGDQVLEEGWLNPNPNFFVQIERRRTRENLILAFDVVRRLVLSGLVGSYYATVTLLQLLLNGQGDLSLGEVNEDGRASGLHLTSKRDKDE